MTSIRLGVLALHGSFAEHVYSLEKSIDDHFQLEDVVIKVHFIRKPDQLQGLHGLIIPGGESTTMAKFLERNYFKTALEDFVKGKNLNECSRPIVWGTCAGLILLSNAVEETKEGGQTNIGGMDITATRNRYGRQYDSFETSVLLQDSSLQSKGSDKYRGVFIRAPGIASIESPDVQVLASYESCNQLIVSAVRQGPVMACSFHPELTDDLRWHKYFIKAVIESFHKQISDHTHAV